ncbi:RagB/SusD family nutrient uptake outer membrane protein [Flavobacterium hercynium]|uniref:RagB/SusD family nutrient uptake outer membrane protein n=1 Tax=Flavobacterium hercynium TaxID=387094 RepID=A0A226HIL8_9FLAO|nr:RagB/SusD family nutrient uptake outer membrane protein [Flavobacterium hercynium]OXA94103.1 RagB/SusD family nutrient uptake outer membrane protein [Flavobacterium hercynium]SMP33102.1 RagB/SusD domain-containing protein [Flavobacterium hercynium]
MKNKIIVATLALSLLFNWSCTDLEENVLDESLNGSGQGDAVSGAIAPAYGQVISTWYHTNNFGLQLIASDEGILPYRGGTDWFDGGKYLAVHAHTTTPTNDLVTTTWNALTKNISRTLSAIEVLTPLAEAGNAEAQGALYEMKALRAYLNMLTLDSWGIVFKKEISKSTSEVLRGAEAVSYIESELLSVADVINKDKGPGRMTQSAVWGLLARLYLNAGVYRDPYGAAKFAATDMDNVIKYTDNIINSGKFNLSPEYFDLFDDNNNSNKEIIFALDQRGVLKDENNRWAYWSIPGSMFPRPEKIDADGTDGPAITSDFYQTWINAYGSVDPADADSRFYKDNAKVPAHLKDLTGLNPTNDQNHYYCVKAEDFEIDRGIMRGIPWAARKDASGAFFKCDGGYRIYPVKQIKGNGPDKNVGYVDLKLKVDFTNEGSLHSSGYRVSKYQFSHTSPDGNTYSSVDIVLLRYAEIFMMRAEAKLRKGDNGGALADMNTVRTSRTARAPIPAALPAINLDILYREYGFEFYWEGIRRTTQIRFGHFEDVWTEKTDTDVNKRLFPIPQVAIDGASNIAGYLVQNKGY